MRRYLLATSALVTGAVAIASPAHCEDVTTKKTTPIQTSTIKAGTPSTINITSAGSVEITSGTAVTMDTNNAVTNAGKIAVTVGGNADGGAGIVANAGTSGDITNSGTITVDEPYTPTDTDNDGDLDGPFALGSDRYGIRTLGDHTGKIVNSGTISVEGKNSAGIALGGKLTGAFTHDGKTSVLGDNSVGVIAQQIDGNVRLAGQVIATGKDAIGARFMGDINGALVVQGAIAATGYRNITPPTNTTKLDGDDLLQGGSALIVEGNVTGGIVLAIPPKDNSTTNNDEDGDGIDDSKEGSAKVVSYGAAPAMLIGATDHAIAIGSVVGTASGYGIQVEGSIEGRGTYALVDANGLQIGGRGGAVTIANGIGVSGTVTAVTSSGNATALRLGSGATTPELRNSGTISAMGAGPGKEARAVAIDAAANLPILRNSGSIKASSADGGTATAIVDYSGTLALVENAGSISASGAAANSANNVAIDLSTRTSGAVVRQTVVGSGISAPSIAGDIRFGSGDDTLDLADGTYSGTAYFGSGANLMTLTGDAAANGKAVFGSGADKLALSGSSTFTGSVDFGGGADMLTLSGSSVFRGTLANATGLAIAVNGGTLDLGKPSSIGSLSVGSGSILVATLDKTAGSGTAITVNGTASFASGSKLSLRLADVSNAVGNYTVLTAGDLQGASNISADTSLIPFLFSATVSGNAPANSLVVDVARKTTAQLGLNGSQALAYDAIFAALSNDAKIDGVFLGITEGQTFRDAVAAMLPDHAGGSFEGVSLGERALIRQMNDPRGPIEFLPDLSINAGFNIWGSDKQQLDTEGYDLTGYTWSLGGEYHTGFGNFSITGGYLWNEHTRTAASSVSSDSLELALGWRGQLGAFSAYGRAAFGTSTFEGKRTFEGSSGTEQVKREIEGKWNGHFSSLAAGLSAEGGGANFFFRPTLSVDYVRLSEGGYSETGGGDALDLVVDRRKSSETGLNGALALGVDFYGTRRGDENWLRLETEGGWREIVSGRIGTTTAHFKNGAPFTLEGDAATSGWFANARLFGGTESFVLGGEVSAEDRHDNINLSLRGTMRIGF